MNNRIVILIELLLAIGLYFVYIQPTYSNTVVPLNSQIAKTEEAKIVAKNYSKKESQITQQYMKISPSEHARLNSFLPAASHNVHFLYDVSNLAANSGFALSKFSENSQNISPQRGVKTSGPTLKISTITLSGKGSYQSFRTFLDGLERSLRIVDIQSINISTENYVSSKNQKNTPSYTYKIVLKVYWLSDSHSI